MTSDERPPGHQIRLAGPWSIDWVGPEDVPAETLAVDRGTFPVDWVATFGAVAGTARFTRKFNRPTGLKSHARVWLTVPEYRGMLSIELNGRVLAILPEEELPVRLDVTAALRLHNRLALEVTAAPPSIPPSVFREGRPVCLHIVEGEPQD